MALPTSGNLSIKTAAGTIRSIALEVDGNTTGSKSLVSLSNSAGKSAPHGMREFYGVAIPDIRFGTVTCTTGTFSSACSCTARGDVESGSIINVTFCYCAINPGGGQANFYFFKNTSSGPPTIGLSSSGSGDYTLTSIDSNDYAFTSVEVFCGAPGNSIEGCICIKTITVTTGSLSYVIKNPDSYRACFP